MDGLPSNVSVERHEDEGYARVVVTIKAAPGPLIYRIRPARTGSGFVISDPLGGKLRTAKTFEQACERATSLAVGLSERAAEEAANDLDC